MDVQNISSDTPIPDPPTDPALTESASLPSDHSINIADEAILLVEEAAHDVTTLVIGDICKDVVMADETQSEPAYREEEYKRRCAEVLVIKKRVWDEQAKEARSQEEMKKKRAKVLAEKASAWKEKAELARLKKQSSVERKQRHIPLEAEPPAGAISTLEVRLGSQATSKARKSPKIPPLPPTPLPPAVVSNDATPTFVRASTEDLFYANKIELAYPTSISSKASISPAARPHSSQGAGLHKTMSEDKGYATPSRVSKDVSRDMKSEDSKHTVKKRHATDMPPPPDHPMAAASRERDVYSKESLSMRDRYIEDRRKAEMIFPRKSHKMERPDHPYPPMPYPQKSYGTSLGERDNKSVRETLAMSKTKTKIPTGSTRDPRISKPSDSPPKSKSREITSGSRPVSIHSPSVSSTPSSLNSSDDKFYQPEFTSSRKSGSSDSSLCPRPARRPRYTDDVHTSLSSFTAGASWAYPYTDMAESSSLATYASTHTRPGSTTLPSPAGSRRRVAS